MDLAAFDECKNGETNGTKTILKDSDLMIGNKAIFEENSTFSVSFYFCNQEYEDAIGSKVKCKPEELAVKHFIDKNYLFGV